ncbi:MAG: hypothetical protein GW903_08415 [Alphaproteobacteria bacterium]|nr:hypothetical protein [Alphaproteobacteria bacterium]NCQ88765.1 hypothetical protein [Alphaproteobacteria bacterium]NCT07312.1 hypothetical protein [Alphaproteobacteria bacterium]
MKNTSRFLLLSACALGFVAFGNDAKAQTANMTATATVQNTLTLATPLQLNFGSFAAVRDAAQTASITVSAAGVESVATTGGTAVTAVVDNTAVSQGQITVADGADGAAINIVINNVVDPINGAESFVLAGFSTRWNGGAPVARTAATPFSQTFDAAIGPNLNVLDIGATLTTTLGAVPYTDGVYNGTYDVVFSY